MRVTGFRTRIVTAWRGLRGLTRLSVTVLTVAAVGLTVAMALHGGTTDFSLSAAWPLRLLAAISVISALGGVLGVLFCIPLEIFDRLPGRRRALASNFMRGGYLQIGTLGGCAIRVHLLLILAFTALAASRWRADAVLALLCIVMIHELGHALLVKGFGGRVRSIDLSPLGGVCRYDDTLSPRQEAVVAWGGVLAQFVSQLIVSSAAWTLAHMLAWRSDSLSDLTSLNGSLIILNLLPVPPLDGARAWRLPGLLWQARGIAHRARKARVRRRTSNEAPHIRLVHDALRDAQQAAKQRRPADSEEADSVPE